MFFERLADDGGLIIWFIFGVSVWMWYLIIERYVFFARGIARIESSLLDDWRTSNPGEKLGQRRLIRSLVREYRSRVDRGLVAIGTMTAVLPLLGLLGTVTGMIKIFEIMTVFGTGNVKGMAGGISEALVTTMAGLVTALSGIFFSNHLEQRVSRRTEQFRQRLARLAGA